jgi:hypothetical protein
MQHRVVHREVVQRGLLACDDVDVIAAVETMANGRE